jgi:putative tryptophan/tyrosine transport system substrate-binding protein
LTSYWAQAKEAAMKRRDFMAVAAGAIVSLPTRARAQARKLPRIGVLWHAGSADEEGPYYRGLLQGFRDLGYSDGQNILFEHRFPNELPELFRSMVTELVALKMSWWLLEHKPRHTHIEQLPQSRSCSSSFLMLWGAVSSRASDVRDGIWQDLERVALLVNSNTEVAPLYKRATDAAASELGLKNHTFDARSLAELRQAFDAMVESRMQAITVNGEGLVYQQRTEVAKMTLDRQFPLAVWSRETFEAGALMSYGADQVAMCRRAPVFVDKILKGAKPADLPVEQPSRLQFFFNVKVAKALGLTVPPSILVRADEVIE